MPTIPPHHTPHLSPYNHSQRFYALPRTPRLFLYSVGTIGFFATMTGCGSGLSQLDRKVDDLVRSRGELLALNRAPTSTPTAPGTLPVRSGDDSPQAAPTATQTATEPATDNPTPDALTFQPADPTRDVASRLDAYAAESTGQEVNGVAPPQSNTTELDLTAAFRIAQTTGREYLSSEEDYLFAAIRLLIERNRWGPRLFNDTSLVLDGDGDDGRYETALSVINDLRVSQRLPYGGTVEASWVARAANQLREQVGRDATSSSALVLSGNIPLLRGFGDIAREDLIQSERSLVYAARSFERFRRQYLVAIANDYFDLVQTQQEVANQQRQLESLRALRDSTKARVEAGRIPAFQQSIAETNVLSAVAALANLRERYILQLDQFKVRLGLLIEAPVAIKPIDLEIPEPDISPAEATQIALRYRLDLQTALDRIDDARRGVENSRNGLLPDLNLAGEIALPSDPRDGTSLGDPSPRDTDYSASITLGAPLDREEERLRLRESLLRLDQIQRSYDEARDQTIVTVRSALRSVDLARFQLTLAEQQVEINKRRVEELFLKIDQVDPQSVVDSQNDLLEAENRRDRARTGLRSAILNYLLQTDTLRVAADGTFQALPGM